MNADHIRDLGRDDAKTRWARLGSGNGTLLLVMGIGALLAAPGCGRGWVFDDAWRDPQKSLPFPLEQDKTIDFQAVLPEHQKAAQDMLTNIEYLRLTGEQTRRLLGTSLPQDASGHPYLIRGVYLFESGRFNVYQEEGVIVVNHGNMGWGTAWRVKRRVLVVWLASPPTKVISTVSIAV